MTLYSPQSLVTKLAIFAISASKRGGQTSLQFQKIWKDGDFLKWLLTPLNQKSFQELVLLRIVNTVVGLIVECQQVRSIDWNFFFFKLKLLISGGDDNC